MAKYNRKEIQREPSHPGEVLEELWLKELGYSQVEFAEMLVASSKKAIKLSTMKTKLNEVISGKRAMSAEFAVLISKVLKTSPKMWMSLQVQLDIWKAKIEVA